MKNFLIILFLFGCSQQDNEENIIEREPWFKEGWEIVWYDEFDSSSLDMNKWSYEVGGHGFGNNELQFYTNDTSNVFTKEGVLHIRAKFEAAGIGESTNLRNFSSARLRTLGKGDWKYVRIDVKAKLALGQGIWPAIWMLPTDWTYGNWPKSGEIDIMEHVGYDSSRAFFSIHNANIHGDVGGTNQQGIYDFDDNENDFNTYAVEWGETYIKGYVNGSLYFNFYKSSELFNDWPYDNPFFLIINLAIGGDWGGVEGIDTSIFPASFIIDYVRMHVKS